MVTDGQVKELKRLLTHGKDNASRGSGLVSGVQPSCIASVGNGILLSVTKRVLLGV